MNVAPLLARERSRSREQLIAGRLRRFAWRHRTAIEKLAHRDGRLADLALSFPALLFALAVPRRRFDPEPAIEQIIAGAPLAELAATAKVPMWARKLMPEAFLRPLPALPDRELFRRQIPNHLPRSPKVAHRWLEIVANVAFWGHDDLAVWFARRMETGDGKWSMNWRPLSLWAWHSAQSDGPAVCFVTRHWTPDMSARQACAAASDWWASVRTSLYLGDDIVGDVWAEPATVNGYTFEPVRTALELIDHARAMNNCARTYDQIIKENAGRIWMVFKNGERVAMLSLGPVRGNPYPTLRQMSGPFNAKVGPEVWLAANNWVRAHCALELPYRVHSGIPPENWRHMWRQYWLAKRRIPYWLTLSPSYHALAYLGDPNA
jgi:hypothetical protein